MDRRSVIRRAGIAGVLASATAPAVHAQPVVRWRLASSFPRSLDTIYGGSEVFARALRGLSGGRFEVQVHAAGESWPAFGVLDAVQSGQIDIAHTAPYYFYDRNPAFALGSAVPFGFNARQMNAWMMHGNGRRLMDEFYADYNMRSFAGGNTGTQMGGWYLREIRGPADFKGMRMRLGGGLLGEVMSRLGAVPVDLPGGDIYQALQQRSIDAAEWVGPYDDQKLGLHKVAPYYYYPGWWEGGLEIDFLVNRSAMDALSSEHREIVRAAAALAHADMLAKYDALNPVALKQLVVARSKVLPFTQSVMDAAFRASMEIFARNEARNEAWKRIYTDMRSFQREQIFWFRFAEMRYDTYLAAQKI